MNAAGRLVKDWWHVLAGAVVIILALGETRWQVRELIRDRDSEIQQWRRINAQGETIVEHTGRLKEIEKHITPEAIQAWGHVRATVAEDHRALTNHLRNHP